jgi:small conductance mechanosensitive channel
MNEIFNLKILTEQIMGYLPRLALAIITLVAGLWLIARFTRFLRRIMVARSMDASLIPFLTTLSRIILLIMLIISVMQMIGVEMTSFIALLGAAGISLGMALSGSLQHFAGGVLLLVYRPFRAGDFIEAQGHRGTVNEIGIYSTVITTIDNRKVFIPNGPLSTGTIVNFTLEDKRRIEMIFGVSYRDDIDKVKKVLSDVVSGHPMVLQEPKPVIGISELAANCVNFVVRIWVKTTDMIDAEFQIKEVVKKEFEKNNITIPFQQIDVNIIQDK